MSPPNLKAAASRTNQVSFNSLTPIEDTKCPLTISEYGSVSRIRKRETDLCLHEDMFSCFSHEDNGRRYDLGKEDMPVLLLPNSESKSLNRKTLKKLSSFPCSKHLRTDQRNGSVFTAGSDDHDAKKVGSDQGKCIYDEKCRIVKQKHSQDSKRIDKRSLKASVKTKFDPFAFKAGFISSDLASGGINTNGAYDFHDVTKHVEELSLNELLDGSYKYTNLCLEKGKKASSGNENILLSARKACSILPLNGAGGIRKASENMLDKDVKDKCSEELSNKDSSQVMRSISTLHRPKDIMERLALPSAVNLETITLHLNPSHCATNTKASNSTSLPAFPWPFSHGGTCRGVDSCKFNQPRSAGQSKWVRIGSKLSSCLEMKTLDHNDDITSQQKINELLEDVKSLKDSVPSPFDVPQHTSEPHVLDHSNLIKGSSVLDLHNSRKLELLDRHVNILENDAEDDFKEHPRKTADDCSQSCFGYPSRSSTGGCGQSLYHSSVAGLSKPGHSSDAMAAAATLCEMAVCSNAISSQNNTFMRIKHPPSQKIIKDLRATISAEKAQRLFLASRHQDTFKRTPLPSTKHKPVSAEKIEVGGVSTIKLLRDNVRFNNRLLQSPTIVEKVYDDQMKLDKGTTKASSIGFGESYIKSWNNGRSKRL